MYELDHMLNGKGSRQHHQDILQWTHHERFACEVDAAQQNQKSGMRSPGIARLLLAALLNIAKVILSWRARRADVGETLQVNSQSFDRVSEN